MLQVHDYVFMGGTGVCRIEAIVRESFCGKPARDYYELNPLLVNRSTVYVPTENPKVSMRLIMTQAEILSLIRQLPDIDDQWIDDDQQRRTAFASDLQSGEPLVLARLVRMLYSRQTSLTAQGKRLAGQDAAVLKQAEQLLHSELALVMDLQPDQVVAFIRDQLAAEAKN